MNGSKRQDDKEEDQEQYGIRKSSRGSTANLALVGGTIAIQRHAHVGLALVLVGQRNAGTNGHLTVSRNKIEE